MFLKSIGLTNFRNFSKLNLTFSPITLVIGDNAQGKSNLLEAIYYLATTKSPRAERDAQLIHQDQKSTYLEGTINNEIIGESTKLEIAMQIGDFNGSDLSLEKRVKVNGIPKRVVDYVGNLVVIYFSPEDINLVSGAPALRRIHLDMILSQIDRQYKHSLVIYSQSLTSRNRILKKVREGEATLEELTFWTNQIIEHGQLVTQKRQDFFEFVNKFNTKLNQTVGSFGEVNFIYKPSLINTARIEEYLSREIASATSLIGPHRDDFSFELNNKNLAFFGSRGQQRMAVLDLKLTELEFIKQTKKVTPVLLLDDVFSELDEERRAYVISVIHGYQTILSSVEEESFPAKSLETVQVIEIKQGEVVN